MSSHLAWFAACMGMVLFAMPSDAAGQRPPGAAAPRQSGLRGLTDSAAAELTRRIDQTVREAGVVESASELELRSQAPGQSTVISVVPDGSAVKEGDLLMTLDDSKLRQELREQQIAVQQAQAGVVEAQAEADLAERQAAASIPIAELTLRAAELARSRYLDEGGELERDVTAAERRLALARQRLNVAKGLLAPSAEDAPEPAQTPEAQLAVAEAQAQVEAALAEQQLLTRHVRGHQTALLELAVLEAEAAVGHRRASAAAARRDAAYELAARQVLLESQRLRLQEIQQQLEHCRIHAPRDGVVLHAAPGARRTAAANLEPGTTVHEGQLLLKMPDLERLQVRVRVHESQVQRVQPGQPVSLRLDAFPTRALTGEVVSISRTPEPISWFTQDGALYGVLVTLPMPPPGIKLGMTVLAEIEVSSKKIP